ncbi:MAG TPA: DUF3786 domain-containing protein, partial [Bacillota bacterium]|nr:DUF3786 domain-containing protein [Bacillota bacterium]
QYSGCEYDSEKGEFSLTSLGHTFKVTFPEGKVTFQQSGVPPLFSWQLIMLNYLGRADGTPLTRIPISYRELENGQVFFPAFQRESIQPLASRFAANQKDQLTYAFQTLGAQMDSQADVSGLFWFLPRFPVQVKIWLPDEEMGGSANILYDAAANCYLHTEDIAVAGNLITNFLIKTAIV